MTNHNKKSHFYGNFKVQITKRKQTEHSMCLSSCGTGYWSIFIYVYMTGCVKCHVYFSTFVFANESWFFWCRVLSCDQSNRAWRWRNVSCGRFMGRRARIPWWWRRLITVRVLMWPPSAKLPRSAPAVHFLLAWYGAAKINHTRKVASCWHA
jgi:hypothetical protein